MAEYIEKKEAINALLNKGQKSRRYKLGEMWELNLFEIEEAIIEAPTAEVQPMKHGRWINVTGAARCETSCTCCNGKIMKDRYGAYIETPFCPHCGADLR